MSWEMPCQIVGEGYALPVKIFSPMSSLSALFGAWLLELAMYMMIVSTLPSNNNGPCLITLFLAMMVDSGQSTEGTLPQQTTDTCAGVNSL